MKWDNVPGKFVIEVTRGQNTVVRLDNDAIITVPGFDDYLAGDDLYYLVIHWVSSGQTDPGQGSRHDNIVFPPFTEDHRKPVSAEVRVAGAKQSRELPLDMAHELFDHFSDLISEQSLPALE